MFHWTIHIWISGSIALGCLLPVIRSANQKLERATTVGLWAAEGDGVRA
jgi:hypothetical protein